MANEHKGQAAPEERAAALGADTENLIVETPMKVHANAEALVEWLRVREPATVREVAATGVMTSRAASDAVHYAVRHGVLEPLKRQGPVRPKGSGIGLPGMCPLA